MALRPIASGIKADIFIGRNENYEQQENSRNAKLLPIVSKYIEPLHTVNIAVRDDNSNQEHFEKNAILSGAATLKSVKTASEVEFSHFVSDKTQLHAKYMSQKHKKILDLSSLPWPLQWPMFFHPYTSDAHVQRMTAFIYVVGCCVVIAWRNDPWAWWLVAGMCGDAGMRVIGGDRLAMLSTCAEFITTFIPGSYQIPSAPQQYAWMFYTCWYLICINVTGFIWYDDYSRVTLAVFLGIAAGFHALQLFFNINLLGLMFERILVHSGIISDQYLHKAYAIVMEQKLAHSVGVAKLNYSKQMREITVYDAPSNDCTGVANENVLLTYSGLTASARSKFAPFLNISFPAGFYLLGVAGLADMWYYLHLFTPVSSIVWKAMAILLVITYGVHHLMLLNRFLIAPKMVMRELFHPHFRFAVMLTFGIPLLSIDYMSTVIDHYSKAIFWICAPIVTTLILWFLYDFFTRPMSFDLSNSSFLIPAVLGAVVSFELPIVMPEISELAWFWLGPGILLWVLCICLIFARLMFGPPLPDQQRGTLFLLVSSGAIMTAAVIYQDPQAANSLIGPYSSLAEFLHYVTTFFALLLYGMLLSGYFLRSPFNPQSWAVSFPSSALALIWLFYWKIGNCSLENPPTQYSTVARCINNQDSPVLMGITILLVVNACVSNGVLALNTALALLQRRYLTTPPRWSPISTVQLMHPAFRTTLYNAETILTNLIDKFAFQVDRIKEHENSSIISEHNIARTHCARLLPLNLQQHRSCPCQHCKSTMPPDGEHTLLALIEELALFAAGLHGYLTIIEQVLCPALNLYFPEIHFQNFDKSTLHSAIDKLQHLIMQLDLIVQKKLLSASSLSPMRDQVRQLCSLLHGFFDEFEIMIMPLLLEMVDMPTSLQLMHQMYHCVHSSIWRSVLPYLLTNINVHAQRMALLDAFAWGVWSHSHVFSRWISPRLDPFLYKRLCVDHPWLKSVVAQPMSRFW